jgi:hypothetical protein
MADLKISQNEEVKDVDESIKKLDVLIVKFENCKLLEPLEAIVHNKYQQPKEEHLLSRGQEA